VLGALIVTSTPMLAVYALVNAASDGWGSALTIGPLAGSVALACLFVPVETRVKTPLVPLSVFRHRNLVSATIVRTLFPMGGFGFNFLGVLYLQHVLGYSPLRTGLAFLPSSAVTGFLSLAVIPWLVRRVGPTALIVTGLALITSGLLAFAPVPVHGRFVTDILPTMVLTGAGFGLVFMPSVSIAMSDVAAGEAGLASGLVNVAVQLGASIGVAALATIASSRTKHLLADHQPATAALTGGYHVGLLVAAGCTAASLVAALVLLRSPSPSAVSDTLTEQPALIH
jgi:Na+/melibiose symporter-like transporter